MTSSNDLARIETRIHDLVADFMTLDEEPTDAVCAHISNDVTAQAIASGEGGKRLRARLALDVFDIFSEEAAQTNRDAMLDFACGIEVFQTAALIHDDIIDDSPLRRGRPSAHRALSETTHSAAIGNGLGIMLGDMLATASVQIAQQAASSLPQSDSLNKAFLTMHREVEIGQVLDLAVEMSPMDDPEELVQSSLNVFRWKTASYTTIAPLEFGLLATGMEPEQARANALSIGKPLGLAFQLADDLLDVVGNSNATGKPVGGDIREGKRTVLLADALQAADEAQRAELLDMWEQSERGDDQVRRAIALFNETGAIARSYERIGALWQSTVQHIESLYEDSAKDGLVEACARFIPQAVLV